MWIIIVKYLIPKGYRGMAIFPFVLLKNKADATNLVLQNHEKIHIRQQLEMLIVVFYIWYVIEFVIKLIYYRNWKLAYHTISLEKEAYTHENDLAYLQSKKLWSFWKYL